MYKGAHREDFDAVQDAVSDLWYIGVDRMVPEKTSAVVGAIEDDDYTSEYVIAFSLSHCDGFDYKGTSDELLDLANKCLNLAIVKHSPRTKTAFAIKPEPVGVPDISDNGWEYSVRLVWTGDTDERLSAKGSMRRKQESLAKKNESDYGAMTWTVTVEFDDNGKVVRKDYVVKAHNRESAIDQAKLRPLRSNPNAKNIKIAYCKLG